MLGAEAAGRVERIRRHVEMKDAPQAAERPPFRHRFERVHRLAGLDLDRAVQPTAALQAVEHEIGVHGVVADADRRILFRPRIDDDLVVLALVARLQDSNDTIVLELLADRAHEDRAHWTSGVETNSII